MNTAAQILADIESTMRNIYAASQVSSPYPMPIIVSPHLPTIVDKRPLLSKTWHARGCYRARITKKWRKRYGYEVVHCCETPQAIFMSAEAFNKLPKAAASLW